ncbi:peptidylprolyl isomerase [Actinomadura sp. WMMA1423]|uniref:protein kinase domain-containing protein n=1 Tax=Actinomadura sp. WMMA1423 TaxID=2591108 RepID=UPI0011477102|nr:peptidylprolyl isomerase [Actinomadura sp. WMMA1423]
MPETRPLRATDPREIGGFRLTARIGEGAQGIVFLGESSTGQRVAAKLLHADIGRDERARTLFDRELAAARSVAPFCTARILAADADGDTPYIVSEYIDGPSLREQVLEDGAASPEELVRLAIGTATALAAIHEAGVVHRDFKPANVLLGPDGPKVIDFGVARPLEATSATLTGAVGTPAYMAPEQVAGTAGGAPLDMFAWGCTMAFAANGVPPFGSESVPAIMQRILYGEPDLGALTGDLRTVVASCLEKEPAARPTALQVLQRLLGLGPTANLLAEGTSAAARRPASPRAANWTPPAPAPSGGAYPPPAQPPPPPGAAGWAPTLPSPPPPGTYPNPGGPRPSGRGGRILLIAGAAAAVVVLAGGFVAATLLKGDDEARGSGESGGETPVARSAPSTSCTYRPAGGTADATGEREVGRPPARPSSLPSRATIETGRGTLRISLDAGKAPCTVNSLAYLAAKKFYDGTSCHRLTTEPSLRVLQCGDPSGTGTGGPTYQFDDESLSSARYTRGTVAMANAGPNTNGSQFFILYGATTSLPASYTVFGQVTSGMDLVDEVARKGVAGGGKDGRPEQEVTIKALRTS